MSFRPAVVVSLPVFYMFVVYPYGKSMLRAINDVVSLHILQKKKCICNVNAEHFVYILIRIEMLELCDGVEPV